MNATARFLRLLPALALLLLGGCASLPAPPEEHDPWEGFNRGVHRFNDRLDQAVLRPVAEVYDNVVPAPVSRGVSNVFSNLDDFVVLFNDLLQFKPGQAAEDFSRLLFNSSAGLFGVFDVATPLGLPKHNEDFGQTLAKWGVGSGPYLVLPFFGPSTLRDGPALAVDWQVNPIWRIEDEASYWGAVSLRAVDARANLLRASRLLEQAALDPYVFTREAWLQHRQNLIYDGNPPMPDFDIFQDDPAL